MSGRGRKTVPLHRVMILEVSRYSENYPCLNFDPTTATSEHVMPIFMVNEKVSWLVANFGFLTGETVKDINVFLLHY